MNEIEKCNILKIFWQAILFFKHQVYVKNILSFFADKNTKTLRLSKFIKIINMLTIVQRLEAEMSAILNIVLLTATLLYIIIIS